MKSLKLLGFVFASALLLGAVARAASNATIVALTGSVALTGPDGRSLAAAVGTELPEGSAVTTAPGGQATVKFFDGTVTIVQPDTNVTIQTHRTVEESDGVKEETELDLKSGGVVNSLDPAKKNINRFRVRTAKGVAAARGTVFAVRITTEGNSTVATMSGTVTFVTDQGEFTVGFGQYSGGNGVMSVADAVAANPGLAADILEATSAVAGQVGAGIITNTPGTPNLVAGVLAALVDVAVQAAPDQAAEIVRNIIAAAGSNLTAAEVDAITQAALHAVGNRPGAAASIQRAAREASAAAGIPSGGGNNPILPPLDQTQIIVSPSSQKG